MTTQHTESLESSLDPDSNQQVDFSSTTSFMGTIQTYDLHKHSIQGSAYTPQGLIPFSIPKGNLSYVDCLTLEQALRESKSHKKPLEFQGSYFTSPQPTYIVNSIYADFEEDGKVRIPYE